MIEDFSKITLFRKAGYYYAKFMTWNGCRRIDFITFRFDSAKRSLGVVPQISVAKSKPNPATIQPNDIGFQRFARLSDAINEDAPFLLRDGGVIKPGYSEELDKVKYVSLHTQEVLMNIEQREREKTGIKNLKIGFNKVFGYYIEVTKSNIPLVKDEFGYIRKQTTSNSERYITEELKELEALILRSTNIPSNSKSNCSKKSEANARKDRRNCNSLRTVCRNLIWCSL